MDNASTISQFLIPSEHNVDGVIFEHPSPCKLIVSFTGMNLGKYDRWSWFYQNYLNDDPTTYIVFKDDAHLFYLNRDNKSTVDDHVKFVSNQLTKSNLNSKSLYCIGSSMGGYAALFYALRFDAGGAILSNPLVNIECARLHKFSLWERQIQLCDKNWIDLDVAVKQSQSTPHVFLSHGQYGPDKLAANVLTHAIHDKNITYTRHVIEEPEHSDTLTPELIFGSINFWNNYV